MKKLAKYGLAVMLAGILLLSGCGSKNTGETTSASAEESTSAAETEASEATATETEKAETGSDKVASSDEMAETLAVGDETMIPITGDQVKDGSYEVNVDCSSAMFKIESCELTVKEGQMTAVMTMGGTGYLYVYMGSGEEAVKASEDSYISFEEKNGVHTFEVPVEALDKPLNCAAFSKKKEKWYDRTILFRADSLPTEAFNEGVVTAADALGLEDGEYTVEVALIGGSGKASVESPAKLTVTEGRAYATIIWSSKNYDYMKIGKEQYLPINSEGNSAFELPVEVFDWNIAVLADTTAMGTPHEIQYSLKFRSDSIQKVN